MTFKAMLFSILGTIGWMVSIAVADEEATAARVRISASPSPTGQNVAGRWTNLSVDSTNPTDTDQEATIVVSLGDEPNFQFGRKVWIPAGASRQAWLPIRIPGDIEGHALQVPMRMMHVRETDRGEEFQANAVGMPVTERSLLMSWASSRTAVLLQPFIDEDLAADKGRTEKLNDAILAGRVEVHQELGLMNILGDFLCSAPHSLDAIDQLIIASDKILHDTMAIQTIQQWVRNGGRLWIMVDQVPPESIRNLLGDDMAFAEIDRVELNEFEMTGLIGSGSNLSSMTKTWSSDQSAEFVRVMVDDADVQCHIDGWPAAFWMPVGNGEVLFTTLSMQGWLDEKRPTPGHLLVAHRFFTRRALEPDVRSVLRRSLQDQIGYTIASRSMVTATLGAHVGIILLVGFWLVRTEHQNWLALLIPVAAFLTAGSLMGMGMRQMKAVPTTVATGQLLQASPDSTVIEVKGVAATYSQKTLSIPFEAPSETVILSSDTDSVSGVRRVVWTDDGTSRWYGVVQPPGVVRFTDYDSTVAMSEPWSVRGRFTPRGFEGTVVGLGDRRLEDALVYRMGSPPLALTQENVNGSTHYGESSATLSAGQFTKGAILSDEQRHRQTALKSLTEIEPSLFSTQPTLLGWTAPIDTVLPLDDEFTRRGSALMMLPIKIERSPSGSPFQVPATFVRFEYYHGDRGVSSFFSVRTGRWLEQMNRPAETFLRCVVPEALLPCKLDAAHVSVRLKAPSRRLRISAKVAGEFKVCFEKENPSGLIDFSIRAPEALEVDVTGGWPLAITITATEEELEKERVLAAKSSPGANGNAPGSHAEPSGAPDGSRPSDTVSENANQPPSPSRDYWNIDYVHVHFEGVTQ